MPNNLPLQPVGRNLPDQPQDPPNLNDVIAQRYQDEVDGVVALQAPGGPINADAARADIYETEVVVAHSAIGAAPAWFWPTVNQVLAPNQDHCGQIPFLNGSMPTEGPYNLPPLTTAVAIKNLTSAEATAYAAGYGLGVIDPVRERRKAIGRFVGCTVSI